MRETFNLLGYQVSIRFTDTFEIQEIYDQNGDEYLFTELPESIQEELCVHADSLHYEWQKEQRAAEREHREYVEMVRRSI